MAKVTTSPTGASAPRGEFHAELQKVSQVLLPLDSQDGSMGDLHLQFNVQHENTVACSDTNCWSPLLVRTGPFAEHLSLANSSHPNMLGLMSSTTMG